MKYKKNYIGVGGGGRKWLKIRNTCNLRGVAIVNLIKGSLVVSERSLRLNYGRKIEAKKWIDLKVNGRCTVYIGNILQNYLS